MHFYPHNIGDHVKDTRHLTLLEEGAYRRLLDHYYTIEKALPLDEADLCRKLLARSDDERKAVGVVLREFFVQTESGWWHKRCEEEIAAGNKRRDPGTDTSISAQVPVLSGLLDHWGLGTTHLVAHDIGGGVAQRFGIFSPERVRTLTLIDVVSFDSYPSERTKQQMEAGLECLIAADDPTHRAHFREWLLSAVVNKDKFSETALDTYLAYISGAIGQASLFQHQIRHYDPKHTMEIANRLHELAKVPVKLIWGEQDAWQVLGWAERLKSSIPGAELSVVRDAAHFSPEDQPEEISRLIIEILKKNA